jgi:hypothetical protein
MALILTIDGLGKRYGMLPSEVLERSNTFDLYIMDAAMTFDNYHHKKALNNGREPIPDFTTDELQQLLDKSKEQ